MGLILFPDNVELQLGLFFTGVSPAGGASNIWTVILGGNLDLSITMSTTSTLSAFGEFFGQKKKIFETKFLIGLVLHFSNDAIMDFHIG